MSTALIYAQDQARKDELFSILSNLCGWGIFDFDWLRPDAQNLLAVGGTVDFHFLIYSRKLDNQSIGDLGKIRQQLPFTEIIYYHEFLFNQQYKVLARYAVNACIIGLQRQRYLIELLPHLWEKHWKKIPLQLLSRKGHQQSVLAKEIVRFIETHTLDCCNIRDIAAGIGQSESHMRYKFKRLFDINFRDFKQQLFNHYETKLLLEKKYKPNEVYHLFNYANVANFSRSFKSRHGEIWRDLTVSENRVKGKEN